MVKIFKALCLGVLLTGCTETDKRPAVVSEKSDAGRYVVVFPRDARGVESTFLVNTAEGQVWQLRQFSELNGDPLAFVHVPIFSIAGDEERFIKNHGLKSSTRSK